MILAFDTYYFDGKARTICLSFDGWQAEQAANVYSEILTGIKEYVSGEFYKRELPCILSLTTQIDLSRVDYLVIDGFVYLDDHEKLGLGGYLYHSLEKSIPVIGVAKNDFLSIKNNRRSITRGESSKPLYITAIGIDLDEAAAHIQSMHGVFRIPKLLKELDVATKTS